MGGLTESAYARQGVTKLYIPNENLSDKKACVQDKDLIQRLEGILLDWDRQIKEITTNQESQNESELAGPIDEINKWRSRHTNLSYIDEQLHLPEIQRILEILAEANSTYLQGFQENARKINQSSIEAEDNLKYLKTLFEPCRKLQDAKISEIPSMLPSLLHRIRMISEKSSYYCTNDKEKGDRVAGLLQKISNEIIRICKDQIKISDMLEGDVEKCIQDLNDAIKVGEEWQKIYTQTEKLIEKRNKAYRWNFKLGSIFVQIEAFGQRCKDLIQICEGQLQFARKGANMELPVFGGAKAPEIINLLNEIKNNFAKHLDRIHKMDHKKILDVKDTKWYDDYNTFKNGMKELDVMYENIINFAFESLGTVQQGVEMLEAFDYLAKRQYIRNCVLKKGNFVLNLFDKELEKAKLEYDNALKSREPWRFNYGKYSGTAIWVRSLIHRIEKLKSSIDQLYFIKDSMKEPHLKKYNQLYETFRNFIINTSFQDWRHEIKEFEENPETKRYDKSLLILAENAHEGIKTEAVKNTRLKKGQLECNYDKEMLRMIREVEGWKRLQHFGVLIPAPIDGIVDHYRDIHRIMREYVYIVVKNYNQIIDEIDDPTSYIELKKLFSAHLSDTFAQLDKGIKNYKWGKGTVVVESLYHQGLRSCRQFQEIFKTYRANTNTIFDICKQISNQMFIDINKKIVYTLKDFEITQERRRKKVTAELEHSLGEIKRILFETYKYFHNKDYNVLRVWFKYVAMIDQRIEDALKKAVKNSLQDLSKTVKGDAKTNPTAIFKLSVVLDNTALALDTNPTKTQLRHMVDMTMAAMTEIVRNFDRMETLMVKERERRLEEDRKAEKEDQAKGRQIRSLKSLSDVGSGKADITEEIMAKKQLKYSEKITEDKEVEKMSHDILDCLSKAWDEVKDFFSGLNKHQIYWKSTPEQFAETNIGKKKKKDKRRDEPAFGEHDEDRKGLEEKKNQEQREMIEKQSGTYSEIDKHQVSGEIKCITVDFTEIKRSLLQKINDWQTVYLNTIQKMSVRKLQKYDTLFEESRNFFKIIPKDLYELKSCKDRVDELTLKRDRIENKIKPLEDRFKMLEPYGMVLEPEDKARRQNLTENWENFKQGLIRARETYAKEESRMQAETYNQMTEFQKETTYFKNRFLDDAPLSDHDCDIEKAFGILQDYKEKVREQRARENEMKFGFKLFNIDYSSSSDLEAVEKNIEMLEEVWSLKLAWEKKWDELKVMKFKDFNLEVLEDAALEFKVKIDNLPRDSKKWMVTKNFKDTDIENFRQTLPLIDLLKQECMRERHWKELKEQLGRKDLDHQSDLFTIEEVFKLNLIQHADQVREKSEVAQREYQIERALDNIDKRWETLELKMEVHKSKYHKVVKTDEIFSFLEEDLITISSQKTSSFFLAFTDRILPWEQTLSAMTETLELLIQVQKQWIYLESILETQTDGQSKKEFSGDEAKFQKQNEILKKHMDRMWNDRNVKRALTWPGFANELTNMSKKFEEAQKNLFELLEVKRSTFPRFYFLSNEDLFELLGHEKEPQWVNRHIKKCFEGIKKIELVAQMGQDKKKCYTVTELRSPDEERVVLAKGVPCEQGVTKWLKDVEHAMVDTLKKQLGKCVDDMKKKSSSWIQGWTANPDNPGQLLLTSLQIAWTKSCGDAISNLQSGMDKVKAWKEAREEQKRMSDELPKLVRKPVNDIHRRRLVAMITIQIYLRDVTEKLRANKELTPNSFEWKSQLRFEIIPEGEQNWNCRVLQTNFEMFYGFEYQGNNGRLVVTPLTDRCYLTLTTAIKLRKGGAPQGPAGTGKTETVKDLGKNLALFVLVFNCSESLEVSSLARMFSGLVQTGGWGCFDEFNRIEVEVLSVVATQISQILNKLSLYNPKDETTHRFQFEDTPIKICPSVAIFITMNPGYAGRSELPDNLKALFRPIAMVVPDSSKIANNLLLSEGFKNDKELLSRKVIKLYELMEQQLSKQDHYDFGLRAIKSVLTAAGNLRRDVGSNEGKDNKKDGEGGAQAGPSDYELDRLEQTILMKAIRDMNVPKLVSEDMMLFNKIFEDLFRDIDIPENTDTTLQDAIEEEMRLENLIAFPAQVTKVLQLYESMKTRHGNMLVGKSLSGKSTCWKILQKALAKLALVDQQKWCGAQYVHLNPKSIDDKELFGYVNETAEWSEGVLSYQMAQICKDDSGAGDVNKEEGSKYKPGEYRWMILDGPVDTKWIESLNTVLDDNKVLTLLNGDRISLLPTVGLLFEVDDLSTASPATVSRCGMVYLDVNDLGWRPIVESWIEKKQDEELKAFLDELFDKWLKNLFKAKRERCKELIPCSETSLTINLCRLLDALELTESTLNFQNPAKTDEYWLLLEKWFAFACIWSVGATVNEEGRKVLDYKMREIESFFPHTNSVYDYFIDPAKSEWANWEDKITGVWKPPSDGGVQRALADTPFHRFLVPTSDTIRNKYVLERLVKAKVNTLSVGVTGTGKTAVISAMIYTLDESFASYYVNFSAQTTSRKTQEIIESKLISRTKTKMVPDGGKKAVMFIDDLNMPRKEKWGAQPPLELLRQCIDYGGWYDRSKKELFKQIIDVQFVTAMGPPGGGRAEISQRIQTKFNIINFTFPTDTQIRKIFQTILSYKLGEFDEEIKPLGEPIALATIALYQQISETFLPIPSKPHYMFNMRDISKVFQGMWQADKFYCDTKLSVLRLWVHECLRVFADRLVSNEDRNILKKFISDKLEGELQSNWKDVHGEGEEGPIFVDFLDDNKVYQEALDTKQLMDIVKAKLQAYVKEKRDSQMNIVLFSQALSNMCKIYRIIMMSKGHALLVGQGGSGRHSLTKLASFIAEYDTFQIKITKNYQHKHFREDLKQYCEMIGTKPKKGVFLFSDSEIVNESFVEDVNNLISTGDVPNLFSKEEISAIKDKARKMAKDAGKEKEESLLEFIMQRIQSHLHVVFCMAQSGDNLRNYTRMYPGLVNNTTIIWFMPWPTEALFEVAEHFLENHQNVLELEPALKNKISTFFGNVHASVTTLADKMYEELRRRYYVTPTNYIELVSGYIDLLNLKRKEVQAEIRKLGTGLTKLEEAQISVDQLSKELEFTHIELSRKQKENEDLLIKFNQDQRDLEDKKKEVFAKEAVVSKDKQETENLARDAEADLQKALPALLAAEERIGKLSNTELAEIKAYTKPPDPVMNVMSVVLIFLGRGDISWASAKKELSDASFLQTLKNFDKNNISTKTIHRVEKITSRPDMEQEAVSKISSAAGELWGWVLAMEKYAKAFRDIEPKRIKVNMLKERLAKSEEELSFLQAQFKQFKEALEQLEEKLQKTSEEKERFRQNAQDLKIRLERADKLVFSLATSKDRWAARKRQLEEAYENLVGDAVISSAFISYAGPFPSEYRDDLYNKMMLPTVKDMKIPYNRKYEFSEFMVKPTEIQAWNQQSLPADPFSIQNAILATKARRWPLMIDPQLQGNNWVKMMEKENKLIVIDLQTDNYMDNYMVRAINNGLPILLQNIGEELDPALDPILNKNVKEVTPGRWSIFLGDREVGYNPNFRFYISTKFGNPRYTAETSTKITLINFSVKEKGLEEQLLSELIKLQDADLEKKRVELIKERSDNDLKLKNLEDKILKLLQETQGSLIDDDNLLVTLQTSKETEDSIKQQMEAAQQTMKKTDMLREQYRVLGSNASHLFFVLNNLSQIDNMYQFSLDSYIQLFVKSIKARQQERSLADSLQKKLEAIDERHKKNVYNFACRSLFEKDKILLSMQLAVKITKMKGELIDKDYDFFLRGPVNVDRKAQPLNPAPDWLSPQAWDIITEIDKELTSFGGIMQTFILNTSHWKKWYQHPTPEEEEFPCDWTNKNEKADPLLQKLIILKAIRPDRVILACKNFVKAKIGSDFINPKRESWDEIFVDSGPFQPIIFILSPGVDPLDTVEELKKKHGRELHNLSLGQGQAKKAREKINAIAKEGQWIYLANCHLSIGFLDELEKIIDQLRTEIGEDSTFRLWLSSNPHPKFPISILQRSVKITTEPPKGIRENMLRLYTNMTDDQFNRVTNKAQYKKLLFSLCWFHCILLERRKFKTLGWNVSYDFNESDFKISENILQLYLDQNVEKSMTGDQVKSIPWDAIKTLISDINYGGRVTDDWDRRLLITYSTECFSEKVLLDEKHKLVDFIDFDYSIPDEFLAGWKQPLDKPKGLTSLSAHAWFYETKIREYPDIDPPIAFGQHINAEISSQIQDSTMLLDGILSLQPRAVTSGSETKEAVVGRMIEDLLKNEKIPEVIDMYEVAEKIKVIPDDNPLKVVLKQELARYNKLLAYLRTSLDNLEKGIKGTILISEDLEEIMDSLYENKVPAAWKFAYHSLKSLGSWIEDLNRRIKEVNFNFFHQS